MRAHVVHFLAQYLRADVAELLAPTWFTCIGLAGLVALVLLYALGRRRGLDSGTIGSLLVWSYAAAVVAGIAMPMLIDGVARLVTTGQLRLHWSGMTSFWGYLAGLGAAVLVCRRDRVPVGQVADVAVIPLGAALVFARLGCFTAGCDYGKITSVPWAVRFPAGSPAWHDHVKAGLIPASRAESLPVHPTELYEALIGVAIIALAVALARRLRARGAKDGTLFLIAAATYSLARLAIVEPLRGDAGRGIYAGLSSGQIFSLVVLVAIAARLLVKTPRRTLATAVATAALVVCVADLGEAAAEPFGPPPPAKPADQPVDPSQPMRPWAPPPPTTNPLPPPPVVDDENPPAQDPPKPAAPGEPAEPAEDDAPILDTTPVDAGARPMVMRPHFRVAAELGLATALTRPSATIPNLTGQTLSVGYTPGWFGVWLDFDHFANTEATHTSAVASVGYARRITPRFTLGARAGLGVTRIAWDAPTFADIVGRTARFDITAEVAVSHDWGVWIRPLVIDSVASADLGDTLTTYRFGIGVDYRFGFHRTRPAHPGLAPVPAGPANRPPPPPPPGQQPLPPVVAGSAP